MSLETMPANAFIGWPKQPTDDDLAATLGSSKAIWDELLDTLSSKNDVSEREWKSYSPKAGWSLSRKRKKRTIVYLIPCSGCFRVAFVLGEKAMKEARASKFPAKIIRILNEAPRYAEGTGVRLDVIGRKDIPIVQRLATIKLAN